jgi:antitoxin component YwqK of YwqJK toxin-antitoxin module
MKKLFAILFLSVLFCSCKESFYLGKIDHMDKNGKRHGLRIKYWDEENTKPMSKTWYVHGNERWLTKTYHNNGNIAVKFKERGKRMKVKYFDRFNHLTNKGWAIYKIDNKQPHYFWHGRWKYFNSRHQLEKTLLYQNGSVNDTLYYKTKEENPRF